MSDTSPSTSNLNSPGIAISVSNVSKAYRIWRDPSARLKAPLWESIGKLVPKFLLNLNSKLKLRAGNPGRYYKDFFALKNVEFNVMRGQTVGVIGKNGSGKSTLLQVIVGTLAPTLGSVKVNGRIAALLELGSGFNPEFTGRENVYLISALLGQSKKEIDARFDDIVSFADIGDFIDQPLKTYSSGMSMRLAFAVNVLSRPDIIIIDEALAVGDMNFQAKCMTALKKIQDSGATILFVSHDIGSIKSLCDQAIYLEKGALVMQGTASEIADHYVRRMREEANGEAGQLSSRLITPVTLMDSSSINFKVSADFDKRHCNQRYGSAKSTFSQIEVLDASGQPLTCAEYNQEIIIRLHFISHADALVAPVYYICDEKKIPLIGAYPSLAGHELLATKIGQKITVSYRTRIPLQEGNYSICAQLTSPAVRDETAEFLDVIDDAIVFRVTRRPVWRIWSKVYVENQIEISISSD